MNAKQTDRLEGRALPVVLLTVFLDVLGVGILIPVLPQLVYNIFIPDGYSFNAGLITLGWLTAISPLMQFLATPVLGQLSDRYGRKPLLGISLFGTAVGYVIFAAAILTKNVPALFIGRGLDGITGGNISVARAVIADVSAPEHRARNFGIIGAAFGMGFVMGPYIGARLAVPGASVFGLFHTPHWFNSATPFWFTAALSACNTLLMFAILPETHAHIDRALKIAWTQSVRNIMQAASLRGLRTIFASEFFFWGGFTFFVTFFQILLIQKLHFTASNVGDLFAYVGICIALAQITIVPLALKWFSPAQILRVSIIGNGLALFLQLLPHSARQLLLTTPAIALFNGLTLATASALVSLSASKAIQGEVLGIEASVQALAQVAPAVLAGYVATMGVGVPVVVGGAVMIFGGVIFNSFYRTPKIVAVREAAGQAAAEL
jgi:MFS transporter, DHA1 family, tetracycline resistance protein